MSMVGLAGFQQFAAVDREAIWAALFAYFRQQLGNQFVSMGRKHIPPGKVGLSIPNQPAFFQVAGKETHIPQKPPGFPPKLVLQGWLIVYAYGPMVNENIGQETVLGETVMNGFLKAIDDVMQPDNMQTGKFTVGGLVTHCWIEGETKLDPGIFGAQMAALLPINILVP